MTPWLDSILILLALTNLMLVGSSLLSGCIRVVAFQGILLGLLPLLSHSGDWTARIVLLAAGSMLLKGMVFPWLLARALREAGVRREIEPLVGYTPSLLAGLLALGVSFWLGARLPLPESTGSSLVVPIAFFTILIGLFLIVSRRQALNQVLGYLTLENGIFAFGVTLVPNEPLLVELGVLLDIFVAVFVMGIAIFHINREFDHLDTDRLATLKH